MGEKVGRPKDPSKDEIRANTVVQRVREIERQAGRALPYPQQLFHERKLTPAQFAATDTIARIYRAWAKYSGQRLNPKSQSFEFTTAGESDHEPDADEQERIAEAHANWERLKPCVPSVPKAAWAWVVEFSVHEHYVPGYLLPDVKAVLDRVVAEFELGAVEDADPHRRLPRYPARVVAPSIVPALKPTRSKPRLNRQERLEKGHYAARTDDAKPGRPSTLTGPAKAAAARDREGLMRTLLKRQALREGAET